MFGWMKNLFVKPVVPVSKELDTPAVRVRIANDRKQRARAYAESRDMNTMYSHPVYATHDSSSRHHHHDTSSSSSYDSGSSSSDCGGGGCDCGGGGCD